MLKLLNINRITPSQKEVFEKLFTKKKGNYVPSITFLTKKQKDSLVLKKKYIVLMKLMLIINLNLI